MTSSSTPSRAPRPELLAAMTDGIVLSAMGTHGEPVSRAEMAETTGLSKPAVSASFTRLADRGVLRETGVREGRRGGVATLFQIDPEHGRSLTVVIHNDAVTVQSRDLAGEVRAEGQSRVLTDSSPAQIITQTNTLINDVTRDHPATLLATTVSIAEPVDARTGAPVELDRSVFPAALIDPRRDLVFPDGVIPVIDNDVNWAALGELREGALRGCQNFVYIYVGEGIGAGLVLDGRLFRGSRGLAGEIGYLNVGEGLDITQTLAELGLGTRERYGLEPDRFVHLPQSIATVVIDSLATAVANVAIVVNPEAVALGGPLSRVPGFVDRLGDAIAAFSIDPPRVVRSDATPLRGASREAHRLAREAIGFPAQAAAGGPR